MKTKKILCILTSLSICVLSLVGCMQKNPTEEKEVTLKYVMPGPGRQADSEKVWTMFNENLQKKLPNVTVEFEVIPLSEYKQKFLLMTSAREQMDIVNNYSLDFSDEVKDGTFEPLDSLLDKYGKEIKSEIPDWLMEYQKVDSKIYGVPSYQMCAVMRCVLFFKDQADEYLDIDAFKKALYKTPQFNQEMYDILTKYLSDMKADGLNFKNATIFNLKDTENVSGMYGITFGDEKAKIKNLHTNDDEYVRFKTAREWFEKGYIRQDALSATDDNNYIGKTDGYAFWDEVYTPFIAKTKSEKYGHEVIAIPYDEKPYIGYQNSAAGTSIMSSSVNKDASMKVLNLIQSDKELYNLLVFGIEGTHYTKKDDENIKVAYDGSPSENDKYGLWKWVVGNTNLAYNIQSEPKEYKKWVFDEVNKSDWRSPLIGFTPDTSNIQDYMTQVNSIKDKYLKTLNNGVLENWEEVFKKYKSELNMVGEKEIITELQKQVDAFLASKK